MIEPWEKDWTGLASWDKMPVIEPTMPALLAYAKADHPDREALVVDDKRMTYGQMEARSAVMARQLLAAGVGKGARIGIFLPNEESFPITWMAITRIGAIGITLPSLATPVEIAKIARHADLHMLIATHRYLHHDYAERLSSAFPGIAEQAAPYRLAAFPFLRSIWLWSGEDGALPGWLHKVDLGAEPDVGADLLAAAEAAVHSSDPAGIIYTSGSTAEPKGVIISQGSFIRQGLKLAASFEYEPGERAYASMPFFWVGGLTTTMMCMLTVGGTIIVSGRKGADLLNLIDREKTTAVVSWPHIMRSLADEPGFAERDWSAMRNGLWYEALPADRKPADIGLMLPPIGMTETNAPYTVADRSLTDDMRGSLGRMMRGLEGKLVDPETGDLVAHIAEGDLHADSGGKSGVLYLRSDVMMLGMVKREQADIFTPDGWYVTGDVVSFRDGHFFYEGRADDLIKAHGANVSPREVEAAIVKLPGVAAAHATGVADKARGTVVGAVVVPEPGVTLDPEVIRRESAKSLASYKVPRIVVIRTAAEMPMLASSKVDRRAIKTLLEDASIG